MKTEGLHPAARAGLPILVFALLLVSHPGHGADGPGSSLDRTIRLKIASFDPLAGTPPLPERLKLSAEPPSGYFVVQFHEAIHPRLLGRLSSVGAEPLKYLPDGAYLVRLPQGSAAAVRALPEVRWAGPVEPGWKLSPDLGKRPFQDPERRRGGLLYATADLFPGEETDPVVSAVGATGAELVQILRFGGKTRLKLHASMEQLERVARIDGVSWIEEVGEITFRNNTTRWVIQTDVPSSTTVWDRGLHGEGQIIGHIDGRLDMNSCYFRDDADNTPGPGHRKVVAYRSSSGQGADSHGTHTAGTSAGDQFPINGTLDNNGHAYEAKISHSNLSDVSGSGTQASNLYDFLRDAHLDGARVHTNSWGDDGTTAYTTWCVDIDQFSYDFEDSLVLFAETNTSTLRTPENAKNVLAVGGTLGGASADNHCTGGVGPTSDGRRKPEIYAPGCSIVSARNGIDCSTRSSSGTSMACPAVTGVGALVRQYFEKGFYPTGAPRAQDAMTPSGALVKAALLNSTTDMTGVTGYPSNLEGWGRVLLENVLFFDGDLRKLSVLADVRNADGMVTTDEVAHVLTVDGSQEQLKITLVYTEPPAALLASAATVNDLDLEVRSPSSLVYLGNVIDSAVGLSLTGGSADAINNVEFVILDNPEAGDWTLTVRATAVNEGTQGYALVASGQVQPFTPGVLRFDSKTILDSSPFGNDDGLADPGETITMPVGLLNSGTSTVTSIASVLSSDRGDLVKITDETADFPDIGADGVATSLAPHYRYTVSPDTVCGTDIRFELATNSSDGEGSTTFSFEIGKTRTGAVAAGLPIELPKKSSSGVTTTVDIAEAFVIGDVQASVDIGHADAGELVVELTSPQGTTVTLHNQSRSGTADIVTIYDQQRQPDGPGTMNDFDGEQAQGTWTLRVKDLVGGPNPKGQIRGFGLDIRAQTAISCSPLSCGEPIPGEVAPSFAVDRENGTDLRFDWPALAGATAYRVWRSSSPDFSEEILVGSTSGTTLIVPGGIGGADISFYQVRAVNACEWEGP